MHHGLKGARIEPGRASIKHLYLELAPLQINLVDRADLNFASCAGRHFFRYGNNVVVVKVQAGHGKVALGFRRLFFDGQRPVVLVEFDNAVRLGARNLVGKNCCSINICVPAEGVAQTRPVKNVVAKDEGHLVVTDKIFANDEGLCEAVG